MRDRGSSLACDSIRERIMPRPDTSHAPGRTRAPLWLPCHSMVAEGAAAAEEGEGSDRPPQN